ncbi:YbaB/EbfC family nucleoid-associated protein [Amycolatopsis jiangsuensis]|uniref:DNA-binding protein YbaB n=1 Tax=Amycolatopsis jiangsuensis TaxID=1181879 RepID=A0A840IY23_9PSEU|nr:YbaB/EbfC family nucleoid-associated protein [Amycolatopsis jiangsuensis]MBB4686187.1 DNA-binding protein YbaB [Amycolatopsis jiangsuensis]
MTGANPGFEGMDPAQAGQEMARWAEQLQRKAQTFQQLQQRMTHLTATATSPDGAVRVTVDSQGVPTELTVTERGRGGDPAALSAQLMACLTSAQTQLSGQVQELVQDTVPEDDPSAERIVGSYRDRFPDQAETEPEAGGTGVLDVGRIEDEEPPSAPPPRRPARTDTDDDEDGWGDQSILR